MNFLSSSVNSMAGIEPSKLFWTNIKALKKRKNLSITNMSSGVINIFIWLRTILKMEKVFSLLKKTWNTKWKPYDNNFKVLRLCSSLRNEWKQLKMTESIDSWELLCSSPIAFIKPQERNEKVLGLLWPNISNRAQIYSCAYAHQLLIIIV